MTCCLIATVFFISETKNDFYVRDYQENDFDGVYKVYKSAFSEEPWDEYKKCSSCKVNYGTKESANPPEICKKCGKPLKLEDYWTEEDVKEDIDYAKSKKWNSILIAELDGEIIGFTWDYNVDLNREMTFLKVAQNIDSSKEAVYVDEVATAAKSRRNGVATKLENELFYRAQNAGFEYVVLRTDERNEAARNMYMKLGFEQVLYRKSENDETENVYDPKFNSRVYLVKKLKRG